MSVETEVQEIPIACTLSAEEQAERGDGVVTPLFAQAQAIRELSDGYSLRFPDDGELALRLLTFVTEERGCCPFFTFEMRFEPGNGPIWLSIRGLEGVKELVKDSLPTQVQA